MRRAAGDEPAGPEAGFTILEVLVPLALVVVVLGAIGGVVATTTRGVRSLEQHVILMETARTVAAGQRSREMAGQERSGELFGYRWRVGMSPLPDNVMLPNPQSTWIPQMMTTRVQSPSGATLSVETVRLQRRRQ